VSYNFLVLALLFLLPGALIFALRPDLRRVIRLVAICSLPFACTEFLFYLAYWEPRFLFDLAARVGFGIEDVIFVVGLGAFTSTVYPFFTGARLVPLNAEAPVTAAALARRALPLLGLTFALVAVVALFAVPMIYGSFFIMLGVSGGVWILRRDLALPGLLGGLLSMLVYTGLCLLFGWLIPGVFELDWHTEHFLDRYLLGIPVEELMYGFAAGVAATTFYPYVAAQRLTRRRNDAVSNAGPARG
jgi:Lycopene cyclase